MHLPKPLLILLLIIVLIIGAVVIVSTRSEEIIKENTDTNTPIVSEEGSDFFTGRVRGPEEVTIGLGQTRSAAGLEITFNDFIQESRCPVDAQCIEAGAVVVNVAMKSGDKEVVRNFPSDEAPFEFEGYKISITKIAPDLKSGEEIEENDYRITFYVAPTAQGNNI
jgi:hypothetical protein